MRQPLFAGFICALFAVALQPGRVTAQAACGPGSSGHEAQLTGVEADYARLQDLIPGGAISPRVARRLSNSVPLDCSARPSLWGSPRSTPRFPLTIAPVSVFTSYNSAYPEDRNTGALWSGRGAATAVELGARLRIGPLSGGFLPVLTYQQNRAYEMLPPARVASSEYSSGLYATIDLPQRFGPDSYSDAHLGNSYIRLDVRNFGVGVSNENIWWGPGSSNAVLFTNTAPGFPHVFININKPLNIGIGTLTAEILWGKLTESDYFDADSSNDHRYLVGALFAYEPRWVPGLFLGIGRTFVTPWDSLDAGKLFSFGQAFWKKNVVAPDDRRGSNDDQRVSLMARYVLPEAGFELYGEWAREDHSWDARDFVTEPEHSAGHSLGFQKLFGGTGTRWARVYAEITNLQSLRQHRPRIRSNARFYVHIPQGHTHRGQMLGASIGPGSESQLFGIDFLGKAGLLGIFAERVRRDEFSLIAVEAWSTQWPPRHDVALTGGVRAAAGLGPLRVDAQLARSKRLNRNFIRDESNTSATFRLIWPGLR